MIRSLVNLRCSAGHRFYAPPREYLEWIGRDCLHGGVMRTNGQTTLGRCLHVLRPVRLPSDSHGYDNPQRSVMRLDGDAEPRKAHRGLREEARPSRTTAAEYERDGVTARPTS